MADHNPVKIVDARPERRQLLLTFNAEQVQIGDAQITSVFGGGYAHGGNQLALDTAGELWCVLRDGHSGPRTLHFLELYDA
jgi:hypothetical protein